METRINQNVNSIQIFQNPQFGQIRMFHVNGVPYFVGNDVAVVLGYDKPRNAIARHVDEDDALKRGVMDDLGRNQETTVINESGLYALIFGSKLPIAKFFKRWVTAEVLPSIRKTGQYSLDLSRYVPIERFENLKRVAHMEKEMSKKMFSIWIV